MNYLRGAFNAASQYYKDLPPINPATLTGAIDVIVVEHRAEDGEVVLACTPFHVRFGKWQVLRPGEKKVNVKVNGETVPFNMKIGDAGEAFFVFETNDDEDVPEHLITSPLLSATQSTAGQESENENENGFFGSDGEPGQTDVGVRKKANGNAEKVGDVDLEPLDLDKPMISPDPDQLSSRLSGLSLTRPPPQSTPSSTSTSTSPPPPPPPPPLSPPPSSSSNNYINNEDKTTTQRPLSSIKPLNILNQTADLGKAVLNTVIDHPIPSQPRLVDKLDAAKNVIARRKRGDDVLEGEGEEGMKGDEVLPEMNVGEGAPPHVIFTDGAALDMTGYHSQGALSDRTVTSGSFNDDSTVFPTIQSVDSKTTIQMTPRADQHHNVDLHQMRATSEPPEISPSSSPQYSWEWGAFPQRTPIKEKFAASNYLDLHRSLSVPPELENDHPSVPAQSINASHNDDEERFAVGTSEAYLGQEGDLSADEDDGKRFLLQLGGCTYDFELSTCGELSRGRDEVEDSRRFRKHQISYRRFMKSPAVVDDSNLVMLWNDRYITRRDGSSLMGSLATWRRAALAKRKTPDSAEDEPVSSDDERESLQRSTSEILPKRTSSSWVRWWKSTPGNTVRSEKLPLAPVANGPSTPLRESPSSLSSYKKESTAIMQSSVSSPNSGQSSNTSSFTNKTKRYAKTLRLTSDQLKALDLKHGSNLITFSLSTSGIVACAAHIFVWKSTDQIVVSDIDGTITKSDALGHVLTMIGRDWTHLGVAKLYTDIRRNGYKIMYLTSRAIGQADSTREYLKGINQNNYQLPDGPVIMSPDRLLASLHREVIMRKPEVFKMACLRDIQRLFSTASRNPFYAGFGNRMTDALSYRSVSIPSARIFTIDSSGEVKMELLELAGYKSSYIHMTDLVDQMFPPINRKWTPEFTDFNYWKQPIQDFPLPELSPPSPALSALSDTSNQSTFSRIRNFSLGRQSPPQFALASSTQKAPADAETQLRKMSSFDYIRERLLGSHEVSETSSKTDLQDMETREERRAMRRLSTSSIPGSLPDLSLFQDDEPRFNDDNDYDLENGEYLEDEGYEEGEVAEQAFNDYLYATGEMQNVPFL